MFLSPPKVEIGSHMMRAPSPHRLNRSGGLSTSLLQSKSFNHPLHPIIN